MQLPFSRVPDKSRLAIFEFSLIGPSSEAGVVGLATAMLANDPYAPLFIKLGWVIDVVDMGGFEQETAC